MKIHECTQCGAGIRCLSVEQAEARVEQLEAKIREHQMAQKFGGGADRKLYEALDDLGPEEQGACGLASRSGKLGSRVEPSEAGFESPARHDDLGPQEGSFDPTPANPPESKPAEDSGDVIARLERLASHAFTHHLSHDNRIVRLEAAVRCLTEGLDYVEAARLALDPKQEEEGDG